MKLICPNSSLFSKKIKSILKKKFYCKFVDIDQKEFSKIAHKFDIVLLRFTLNLYYQKKTKIKYIISPTTGLNHIDNKFILSKNIKIIFLKDKNFLNKINSTAEHTIFLILNLIKKKNKVKFGFKNDYKEYISKELHGKTVGIIGYGRIGKKVAKICKAFGAKIIAYDKYKKFKINNSLNKVLKNSDIISFHVPLNVETNKFFDKKKLKKIKKDAIIINTSRGEIFEEKYLFSIAKKGKVSLGLDVLSEENNNKKNNYKNKFIRLSKTNNKIFITPHVGGLSKESIRLTDEFVLEKFLKIYKNIK
jgi:D-3-phosphoglycerate dehydrogenase